MKLSLLGYVSIWGMTAVEAAISLCLIYRFLLPLRIYFGVIAVLDIEFFFVQHRPDFHLIFWYTQIFLLLFEAFIVAKLLRLLFPRLTPAIQGIIPAVIATTTLIGGKPGTVWFGEGHTHHMLVYEIFCLALLVLVLCFGIVLSRPSRYEDVAIGFGMLLAAQAAACLHRLYVGLSPFVWNLCWLVGICFIVHALFTYDPPSTFAPLKRSQVAPKA